MSVIPAVALDQNAPSGTDLFARAAHWLNDQADIYDNCIIGDGTEPDHAGNVRDRDEMRDLARRLLELNGEWEKRVSFSDAKNAALIVHSMLVNWKLPGSVWYSPKRRRFRVAGEDYRPMLREVLVGVYLPSVDVEALEADFAYVMEPAQ